MSASGASFGSALNEVRVEILVILIEKLLHISPGARESMNVDERRPG